MNTFQLIIACATIIISVAILCYTAWSILTNEKIIRYVHDYLKSRKND